MTTAEPVADDLARLAEVEHRLEELTDERVQLIADAQRHGASWEDIGSVLGVSRQAAWHMYRERVMRLLDQTASRATASEEEIAASAAASLKRIRARRHGA